MTDNSNSNSEYSFFDYFSGHIVYYQTDEFDDTRTSQIEYMSDIPDNSEFKQSEEIQHSTNPKLTIEIPESISMSMSKNNSPVPIDDTSLLNIAIEAVYYFFNNCLLDFF